jgi:hypothetical protein
MFLNGIVSIFMNEFLNFIFMTSLKIPTAGKDIRNLDHQLFTDLLSFQGSRITTSLNNIDPVGMELPATIIADHGISLLAVSFFSGKTDITSIKSCTNNPVRTLDYKKFYSFVSVLIGVIVSFSIAYIRSSNTYFTVAFFD